MAIDLYMFARQADQGLLERSGLIGIHLEPMEYALEQDIYRATMAD